MKSSSSRYSKLSNGAFTLGELLVTISVMLVLSALVFPVVSSAKNRSRQAVCASNVGQISKAVLMYVDDSNGWPVSEEYIKDWAYQVAPYYGRPKSIICPSFFVPDTSEGYYRQLALPGYAINACLLTSRLLARDANMKDPSLTILIGEAGVERCSAATWHGNDLTDILVEPPSLSGSTRSCKYDEPRGDERHNSGANYAFADGHLKWHRPSEFAYSKWVTGKEDPCYPDPFMGPVDGPRFFTKWR